MDDATRVIAALRQKYPQISNPPQDDICYATQHRQDAVPLWHTISTGHFPMPNYRGSVSGLQFPQRRKYRPLHRNLPLLKGAVDGAMPKQEQ